MPSSVSWAPAEDGHPVANGQSRGLFSPVARPFVGGYPTISSMLRSHTPLIKPDGPGRGGQRLGLLGGPQRDVDDLAAVPALRDTLGVSSSRTRPQGWRQR